MTFRDIIGSAGGWLGWDDDAGGVDWHEHDAADISGEAVFTDLKVDRLLGGTISGKEIIVAGGVDGILRSDNYSAGSAGWRIDGSGAAEFNDVTVRGTIEIGKNGSVVGDSEGFALPGYARTSIPELELKSASIRFYDISTPDLDDYRGRVTGYDAGEVVEILGGHTVEIATDGLSGTTASRIFLFNETLRLSFNGSASAPAISWAVDTDTGLYRPGANGLGFVSAGTEVFRIVSTPAIAYTNHPTTANAANAVIDATSGVIARSTSSKRYKTDIAPFAPTASILDLTPSTFRPKDDPERQLLGLIAEDVAEHFPLAALYDDEGRPDAIDWNAIVSGLVAEVRTLRARVGALEAA